MTLSIIAAVAQNRAIGRNNQLLWHISEDLRYFKQLTSGHTVIMGRKTFESIGKPLPNRHNTVISRTLAPADGISVAKDLNAALAQCLNETEVFIIGGGSIYREALPLAHRLYLTEVHADCDGDTFFPEINRNDWKEISRQDFPHGATFPYPFSFVVYERK
ncbi:MAG: dihydrofolate reductase [Prevotellaceae bacterium]|jgi:dihydrofolate reductase|nr:dihydrofolate reductase [Prevotellaceae bacterium]